MYGMKKRREERAGKQRFLMCLLLVVPSFLTLPSTGQEQMRSALCLALASLCVALGLWPFCAPELDNAPAVLACFALA